MCVANKYVTKYVCGHRENRDDNDYCEDYVTYGECNNQRTRYLASHTSRTNVCSACRAAKTGDTEKGKDKEEHRKDNETSESNVESSSAGYCLMSFPRR